MTRRALRRSPSELLRLSSVPVAVAAAAGAVISVSSSLGCKEVFVPTPTPQESSENSNAGDFYADFLRADPYSKLIIEIDVMDGVSPDSEAVDTLVDSIAMLCNKPDGTEVRFPDDVITPTETDNPEYTLDEIKSLESEWRDSYTDGDTAVMYFLYVNGHSDYDDPEEGTAVLGYAYRGSSMAIFMGTINTYPPLVRADIEKTVTVHEFGHIAGLVDNGADMVEPHSDEEHAPHCDNESCMMYWLNNYSSIVDLLDGEIPEFDDNCLADIAAAGGKDARGRPQPR